MKNIAYVMVPQAKVFLTGQEVYDLWNAATHHYDSHCKSYAKQGGLIFGFLNVLETDPEAPVLNDIERKGFEVVLPFRELDTLCKICEMMPHVTGCKSQGLWFEIKQTLRQINELAEEKPA